MEYPGLKENILVVTKEPLAGANFKNLIHLLLENHLDVDFRYLPRVLYSMFLSSLFAFYRIGEHYKFDKKIEETTIEKDPIFVIGHWRSGTTYLHNLLCLDEKRGYFTTFSVFLPEVFLTGDKFLKKIVAKSFPKKRPMDEVDLDIDLPQEEEYAIAAVLPFSSHHSLCFPRNALYYTRYIYMGDDVLSTVVEKWKKYYLYLLKKMTYYQGGKQLVLKNPSNTARVGLLLEMFPNAKFIHICRNPYHVYLSTIRFLKSMLSYFCLQTPLSDRDVIAELVFSMYKKMHMKYFKERKLIPDGNLIEIKYEDFIKNPQSELKRIYSTLKIDGYEDVKNKFQDYISGQKNYKSRKYEIDEKLKNKIYKNWKPIFEKMGYKKDDF